MSWRAAITTLAGVSVAGVTTSYDLNGLPRTLPAADLPALLPAFGGGVGNTAEENRGLSSLAYDGTVWRSVLYVDHMLYWRTGPAREAFPGLLDAVDAYLSAVSAQGDLGGLLDAPLQIVSIRPGVYPFAGVDYAGVCFRHRWVRVLT